MSKAREGEYLMAALHKFRDQAAAKQASPACDEDSNSDQPSVSKFRMDRMALSRMSSTTAEEGGAVLRRSIQINAWRLAAQIAKPGFQVELRPIAEAA